MNAGRLKKHILSDLRYYGGKSLFAYCITYFFNASFRLMLNYRLGRYFKSANNGIARIIGRRYKYRQETFRNCDISYEAVIGDRVKFMHPIGIVIGENVIIHDNVKIWQQVTLGSHGKKGEGVSYPEIFEGVKIFAGAKIIGGIKVGANSTIGANSVVLHDVPENAVVAGVPAKIIKH